MYKEYHELTDRYNSYENINNVYYINNELEAYADLYGKDEQDMGYLKTLGYYNGEYDRLSNLIINLQDL